MTVKKVMMVGDGYAGKTSMVHCFAHRLVPGCYRPTIIDNFSASVRVAGRLKEIMIWDTSGQEDWAHIRKLAYFDTDLIIAVFDLTNRESLDNISYVWFPEVKEFCPDAPIILAGNKKDLKRAGVNHVTPYEGQKMAKKIGAKHYIECSALNDEGIDDVFNKAGEVLFCKKICTVL